MQPLVLTLPDEIRDALARDFPRNALDTQSYPRAYISDAAASPYLNAMDKQRAAKWVEAHLLPPTGAADPSGFLAQWYDALLGAMTGSGKPSVLIKNLPTDGSSPFFMVGLATLLGDLGKSHELIGRSFLNLHRDFHHHGPRTKKCMQFLYYENPGDPLQHTEQVTADEVLHRYCAEHPMDQKMLVEKLKRMRVVNRDWQTRVTRTVPALSENPNWEEGSDAVRFFFNTRVLYTKDASQPCLPEDQALWAEICQTARRCCEDEVPVGEAIPERGSMLLWNDSLLHHGRVKNDEDGRRRVYTTDSRIDVPSLRGRLRGQARGEFNYATDGPVCFLDKEKTRKDKGQEQPGAML